jgi:hypothetical protein
MVDNVLTYLNELGPSIIPITVLVLVGAVREWWVWGYVFRREVAEKEFWRDKALDHLGLAEVSLTAAEDVLVEEI